MAGLLGNLVNQTAPTPAPAPAPTPTPAPTTKPPAPTGPATTSPTAPTTALPVAPPPSSGGAAGADAAQQAQTAQTAAGAISPPPLATTDPLAFAPPPPVQSASGQTFVGGTQSPTSQGMLGYGSVPYSNGQLTDLGGGMVAPVGDVSNGIGMILPSGTSPTPHPDQIWYQGKVVNWGDLPPAEQEARIPGSTATAQPGPQSLADLVDPTRAPASGGSGYANSPIAPSGGAGGNLVPAGGNAQLAPSSSSGSPGVPSGPATGAAGAANPTFGQIATSADPRVGAGVNTTPTTVENALTNSTISPGAMTDRFGIARNQLSDTIRNVLDPQFQSDQQKLNRYNFGAGRGVSGAARTSQGDLLQGHERDINQLTSNFLNPALTGSIEDAYRNIGIAQQQQGFQAGQQNTAFNQGLQQLLAGSSGDPSQVALILSQIFGSQAGQAGNAANNYAQQQAANTTNQQNQYIYQPPKTPPIVDTPIYDPNQINV